MTCLLSAEEQSAARHYFSLADSDRLRAHIPIRSNLRGDDAMHALTLLIVEDEERMRRLFELVLKPAGYDLLWARSGAEAISLIQDHGSVDMIITDLQLGGLSGMDVLEAAREHLPDVPVLIVTGYGTVKSAVEAMQKGAYDYISKPVSPKVFISRVNALFRRVTRPDSRKIELKGIVIDPERFIVTVEGREVTLAKKEFELLYLLAQKPGRVFLRNEILNQVWGNEVIVGDRTVDVHIRKIRQKLEADYIRTVKGVGYKFDESVDS